MRAAIRAGIYAASVQRMRDTAGYQKEIQRVNRDWRRAHIVGIRRQRDDAVPLLQEGKSEGECRADTRSDAPDKNPKPQKQSPKRFSRSAHTREDADFTRFLEYDHKQGPDDVERRNEYHDADHDRDDGLL